MEQRSQEESVETAMATSGQESSGKLFGIPLGKLGLFSRLLIGAAMGLAAFFAGTFVGIVSLVIWSSSHPQADYSIAYRRFGFPFGVTVLVLAWVYLGAQWVHGRVSAR